MDAWLTLDSIPERAVFAVSLPNSELWRAQFLGALLLLTEDRNWEEYGALSSVEMADEWRSVFFDFISGETSMIPVGAIMEYGGNSLPDGFLWARGQAVSRVDYAALFAVYGTTFGLGNGVDTFGLPHRASTVAIGLDPNDTDYDALNKQGGAKQVYLEVVNLPQVTVLQNAHTHTQNAHTHTQNPHDHVVDGGINAASGAVARGLIAQGLGSNNTVTRSTTPTNQNATATNQNATATNQPFGGNQAHENRPQYIVMNFIIKY